MGHTWKGHRTSIHFPRAQAQSYRPVWMQVKAEKYSPRMGGHFWSPCYTVKGKHKAHVVSKAHLPQFWSWDLKSSWGLNAYIPLGSRVGSLYHRAT